MTSALSATEVTPEFAASDRVGNGPTDRLIDLDRVRRARPGGRGAASPAVRVLVADGQALARARFQALLEGDGRISVVGEAATGEEVVSLARRIRPDVVLIDASLPGLDCVEATGRLVSESGASPSPVAARTPR